MKIKLSEATPLQIDWLVASCLYGDDIPAGFAAYSTDWAQGGPIIEREGINLLSNLDNTSWSARVYNPPKVILYDGNTPLIAAMRCYVASKLGDEVEVPDELKGE